MSRNLTEAQRKIPTKIQPTIDDGIVQDKNVVITKKSPHSQLYVFYLKKSVLLDFKTVNFDDKLYALKAFLHHKAIMCCYMWQ